MVVSLSLSTFLSNAFLSEEWLRMMEGWIRSNLRYNDTTQRYFDTKKDGMVRIVGFGKMMRALMSLSTVSYHR